MEKNFDDIILENNNKSDKLKKLLLRIIALVILFLVVMIMMKLLNSSDDKAQTLFPAEPNATEFENIPVSQGGELDEFEALKQQMQGFEGNASVLESNNTFVMPLPSSEINATQTQEPTQPAQPSVKPAEKPASVKPADKPATTQKPATKPATQKPATQKPATTQKPASTQKPATAKPAATQKPATTTSSGDKLTAGAYIQIFSVSNFDPKSKELKSVEQNGYKYSTQKSGERTKILVGPFDKDELNAELNKVRQNINKDAFVVQVK